MRLVFITAGLIALGASTMMAIGAAGGLSAPVVPGLIAMGVVLAVGAAAIGAALASRYVGLAVVIGIGMIAGEVGAMIQTAQRVTAAREAQRAPLVAEEEKRKAAIAELAAAETAKLEPVARDRLEAATAAKAAAERIVADKAAERGCRENCRQLLQAAVDAAGREVDAARTEFAQLESRQEAARAQRITNAKSAVAALKPPQSASPLAEHSGIPEWLLDVVEALALSLAINIPASALIALGVKMRPEPAVTAKAERGQTIEAEAVTITPREHAARFGVEVLTPGEGSTPIKALHPAYVAWCQASAQQPFAPREIGSALMELFNRAGLEVEKVGNELHVIGALLRDRLPALGVTRNSVRA